MTRRSRRNVANSVIVLGAFLVSVSLFAVLGLSDGDPFVGAFGVALVVGGWLWRDRFD